MQENVSEELCARLCLLTRIAWDDSLPKPFSRAALQIFEQNHALNGLVLRETENIPSKALLRARLLLTRTKDVFQQMEQYEQMGYRGLVHKSRAWADALHVMGREEPHFLFAKGNVKLLKKPLIAVAGSRKISGGTADMAARLGKMLADEHLTMVSGGAFGVDQTAQNAILDAGGNLIVVPAVPAERICEREKEKRALEEGRMLVLCDTLPDAPFSAAKALGRNHVIYALGKAAIVAASREGVGGSWRGATDCLKGGYTPVYAPDAPLRDCDGNRALFPLGVKKIDLSGDKTILEQIEKHGNSTDFSP